jgi:hypothetical protein
MSLAVPGFERKKHENPYNYSEAQLADKDLCLKNYVNIILPFQLSTQS